jgi:hypothetical protein
MRAQVINLRRQWPYLKHFLGLSIVQDALDVGMMEWCEHEAYLDRRQWDPKRGPWWFSRTDYWCDRKPPKRDSPDWYKCVGACHWLRGFACALGREAYPRWEWWIVDGDNHSTAVGLSRGTVHVLDFNLWDYWPRKCADQILDDADFYTSRLLTVEGEIAERVARRKAA